MNDVVEVILKTYQSMCPLDIERAADLRQKISRYIETLASAGQRDAEQLTIYGLAYLTELQPGARSPVYRVLVAVRIFNPKATPLHAGRLDLFSSGFARVVQRPSDPASPTPAGCQQDRVTNDMISISLKAETGVRIP